MKPSELLDIMKDRRSVRQFLPGEIPESDVRAIIEAAIWAPSASNKQNWRFIAIRTPELKQQLLQAITDTVNQYDAQISSPQAHKEFQAYSAYFTFFTQAPVVIAVIKKPYDSMFGRILARYKLSTIPTNADIQGPAAAIQNMLLMAHAMGYGTCWMTGPLIAKEKLEDLLNIEAPEELMAIIPIGIPANKTNPTTRAGIAEVLQVL